jgi:glycosyltransferase involved in cell wall biosynthesis
MRGNSLRGSSNTPINTERNTMRLAYISADFGIPVFGDKGASIHIQEMVGALCELGHEVEVFSPRMGKIPAAVRAKLHRAKTVAPQITEADLGRAEQSDRVFKERRNMAAAQSVLADVRAAHKVMPFDAIYERYSLWSDAGTKAGQALGVPCALEVNAPLLLEQKSFRQLVLTEEAEKMEASAFSGADLVYGVSQDVVRHTIAHGASPQRAQVLPNAVNRETFHSGGPKRGFENTTAPVIGFSGSLKPWHGLEDLLQAYGQLQRQGLDCQLLIAGDGPMRGFIEGFAQGAGLSKDIFITGWLGHDLLPDYLRRMDVAVAPYPALDPFYFSPLKVFEYMACGRAVVASRIGQIPEFVRHGETGLLFEPGNTQQLATQLAAVLTDGNLRHALGSRAENSMQSHTWRAAAARVTGDLGALKRKSKAAA